MFRCKFKGVLFDAVKVVAFSEKLVNVDQQQLIVRGNYPSADKDTNCIKICVNIKGIYIYVGNLPSEEINVILESMLVNGYLNLDNDKYKFIVDPEDKIKCYLNNQPYIFTSAFSYQRLADDVNESIEYRTMNILEEDNVFLHPELLDNEEDTEDDEE